LIKELELKEKKLQENRFNVKPILSPTIPKAEECFCLHSYKSEKKISKVLQLLATFVNT
jgi:8-amino-7-oxononanoate synthase